MADLLFLNLYGTLLEERCRPSPGQKQDSWSLAEGVGDFLREAVTRGWRCVVVSEADQNVLLSDIKKAPMRYLDGFGGAHFPKQHETYPDLGRWFQDPDKERYMLGRVPVADIPFAEQRAAAAYDIGYLTLPDGGFPQLAQQLRRLSRDA